MTEKDLKQLKFKRQPADNSYYYTLDIGNFCLITKKCKDEVKNDNWTVTIWESEDIQFNKKEPVEELINIIKAHKTRKK